MREIKFRAWLNSENKFAYSDQECLTCADELIQWYFNAEGLLEVGYVHEESNEWVALTTDVEQFTGINDKNGTEIYEKDILGISGKVHNQFVYFQDGFYCTDEFALFELIRDTDRTFEVIGNKHENPELLNQK